LPYFAKYFRFDVCGLDRSSLGCEKARLILARESVDGRVYTADLFSPPEELFDKFDVAISFGVVEHFENTTETLKALRRFLVRGGMMLTVIPNFVGLLGTLQRLVNQSVYDIHVPLDKDDLASA